VNHYLLRFIETGRDAQRKKQPRDLQTQLPHAICESAPGRLYVTSDEDASAIISSLHGVTSWSPCLPSTIEALPQTVLQLDLTNATRFAVKVKRFGTHDFSSLEMARKLAAALIARWPQLEADLRTPQVTVGVEIRDQRAWVYDRVFPGIDRRGTTLTPTAGKPRFVADQMLGRLAAWLRMLGFDTTYAWDIADSEVVRRANTEGRVVLTRDRPLSKNQAVRVLFVENRLIEKQVREVLERLSLRVPRSDLFSRCALCNAPLTPVDKQAVQSRVPASAFRHYDRFAVCEPCDKVYWAGSHYQRVLSSLGDLLQDERVDDLGQ
jgi:uncharacterized protein with PIN domain